MTRAVVDALEQRRMLSVTLSNGVLTLTGTGGNDVATFAPSGSNLLVSDNGTNYSYALTSVNQIVVNLNHGNDSVTMSAGLSIPASLVGGNGDDTLVGSDGDDTLLGGAGLDSLSGAGGNDVLNGGTGADAMFGGSGVDRVDYFARTANLVITLNGIANDGEAGENDNIHTDVEHVIGGSGNDDITGSASNNSLVGNDGNDTLRGLTGDDTLQGNAGEDVLQGGQGADIVDGGTGIDWSLYDDNPDALNIVLNGLADDGSAGEGDNTTTENIRGGIGNDTIIGSSANNLIEGLDGNDIIKGMGGNDTLVGGAGDDTLDGGWGSDVLQGDTGTDTATYSGRTGGIVLSLDGIANDTQWNGTTFDVDSVGVDVENVIGSLDADSIVGSDANNMLSGSGGNDTVIGLGGDDVLFGEVGHDALTGGHGNDTMWGGDGDDTLHAADGYVDFIDGGAGTDSANVDSKTPSDGSGGGGSPTGSGGESTGGGSGSESYTYIDLTPLPATGLAESGVSYTDGATITWQDNATDEDRYLIEWSGGSEWFTIDELDANSTSYFDEYPIIGTQQYRVVAQVGVDITYESTSDPISMTPIAVPVASPDDNAGGNDRGTLSPYQTKHGRPMTFNVMSNDIDFDSTSISISSYTQPQNGDVTLDSYTGTFTYTPDEDFVGTDTFTYTVFDGYDESAPTKVAIDVTNAVPVVERIYRTFEASEISNTQWPSTDAVWITGTLSATDADADAVTIRVVDEPQFGALDFDPTTRNYRYTLGSDFKGIDRFTYVANDGVEDGEVQVVTLDANFSVVARSSRRLAIKTTSESPLPSVNTFGWPWQLAQQGSVTVYRWTTGSNDTREVAQVGVWNPGPWGQGYHASIGYTGNDSFSYHVWGPGNLLTARKPAVMGLLIVEPGVYTPTSPLGGPINFSVSPTDVTTFTNAQTGFVNFYAPNATTELGQQAVHGTVVVNTDGSFTYTPDAPEEGEEFYLGWDFFSYVHHVPGQPSVGQWVQLDLSGPPMPASPRPENEWVPEEFDGSLTQLWQKYIAAKDQIGTTLVSLAAVGDAVRLIDAASTVSDTMQAIDAAQTALDQAHQEFDLYIQKFEDAHTASSAYMRAQWHVSQADRDVEYAIMSLPFEFGGLRANADQLDRIGGALSAFGEAAMVQVDTTTMVVNVAESLHLAAETATYATGVGSVAVIGGKLTVAAAKIATQQGVKALAKAAVPVAVQASVVGGVAYGLSTAEAQAQKLGLGEQTIAAIKINAASVQLIPMLKAAKAQASATPPKWEWNFGGKRKPTSVMMSTVSWTKVDDATHAAITAQFNNTRRAAFLQSHVADPGKVAALRQKGLTDIDLTEMFYGRLPSGYQVHHKKPREFGGSNEDGNLMLIKSGDPNLHDQLTKRQGKVAGGMEVGHSRTVEFPMFEGNYFANERGIL